MPWPSIELNCNLPHPGSASLISSNSVATSGVRSRARSGAWTGTVWTAGTASAVGGWGRAALWPWPWPSRPQLSSDWSRISQLLYQSQPQFGSRILIGCRSRFWSMLIPIGHLGVHWFWLSGFHLDASLSLFRLNGFHLSDPMTLVSLGCNHGALCWWCHLPK